jgi:hypothetical protein
MPADRNAIRSYSQAVRYPARRFPCQNWHSRIHMVGDENVRLPGILSVKPSHILGQCPLPGDRHRQEQRIEPRIVEAFANVASGRQYNAFFPFGDAQCRRQLQPTLAVYGSSKVVSAAPSSATKTAINSAGSVVLAFAETTWVEPGGSKNVCPTVNVSRGPPPSCERISPLVM